MARKSKSAAGKTPFHAVVEKVQRGTISDKEFSNYFVAQPNPRQPFDFTIGINRAAVELQGVEKSGKFADALVHDASIGRDRQIRRAAPPKGFQRKSPIVAEGDSWFRLPQVIMPPTLIDVLQETYGYAIDNMAHWGDTLADMIQVGQFWPPLTSGQADTFLFSAGGNDVLGGDGGIARFLNLFDVGHTKPSDAAYYIKPEFYQNLRLIVQSYEFVGPARAPAGSECNYARSWLRLRNPPRRRAMDRKRHDVRWTRSHFSACTLPGDYTDHDRCL